MRLTSDSDALGSAEYQWPGNTVGSPGSCASACRLRYIVVDVAAGEVGAPAALEEQRVAGDEPAVEQEALAARRVAGGVQQFDVDVADADLVAVLVRGELAARDAGDA